MIQLLRPRLIPFLLCVAAVVTCLAYSVFRAQLPTWWRLVGGGIPYVAFWIFLWATALPDRRLIAKICVGVVLFTCFLEVLQLWNPEPLASFRQTRFGAALLGNTFQWSDFPPYFMGGLVGYVSLRLGGKQSRSDDGF